MLKIKVIKKADLKGRGDAFKPIEIKTARQENDQIASTISHWINDFETQRRRDTEKSTRDFFITSGSLQS